MKTKVVLEEHQFQVLLVPNDGRKDTIDMGATDKPPKDVEPIAIANLAMVTKNLNTYNRSILDRKLKLFSPGQIFRAELKYIRKDETPDLPNPLDDETPGMGSTDGDI